MAFEVSIDNFEGPLDLMLHLIKENKLDLFDLDMNILADQYILYINTMEDMHLEVASEYLSELAGLLEYKSKKLLPKEKIEISEEYEENQLDKLRERLIEYNRFKEASLEFEKNYKERAKMLEKPISDKTQEWVKKVTIEDYEGNPYDLIKAMNRVLRRYMLNKPQEALMSINEMSTEDRIEEIKTNLSDCDEKIDFETLCNDCDSLHMVIITFLAVLVLIKENFVSFSIDDREVIWIRRV